MKKYPIFIGLVLILLLSACATPQMAPQNAVQGASTSQQQQQSNQTVTRTIQVNGTGQVTLAPDVAYVYIGVHSQSDNVADALSQNNDKAQAVSNALKEIGVDPKDIQTSSFNVYPQQQTDPQGNVTSTLYNVDNTVYVTVRDLQNMGKLLDTVVRSGANSINSVTFDVLDKSKALSEARKLAVDSARSQAEELAQNAGVSLGGLQTMNVFASNTPIPMYAAKGMAAADASQVPVSAGQIIIRVEVSATYFIQ
jgi:uncharacterized protein YggE